jgi:hypothetical protein
MLGMTQNAHGTIATKVALGNGTLGIVFDKPNPIKRNNPIVSKSSDPARWYR